MFKLDTGLTLDVIIGKIESHRTDVTKLEILHHDGRTELVINGSFVCYLNNCSHDETTFLSPNNVDRLLETLRRMHDV